LWLNAKALALAEFPTGGRDPSEEKYIIRDAAAIQRRSSRVRWPSSNAPSFHCLTLEEKLAILSEGAHYLNRYGITSITNATGDLAEIELYAALRDRGQLTDAPEHRSARGRQPSFHSRFLAGLEKARSQYHDDWVSANLVNFR